MQAMDAALNTLTAAAILSRAGDGRFTILPHGGRLYFLEPSAGIQALRTEPGIATAASALDLDRALRDGETPVILVTADAGLSAALIESMCRRHGAAKTILLETGRGA